MEFFPVYERTIHKGQRIPERRYHMKGRQSQRPESKSTYQPFSLTSSGSFMMGSLAKTITGGSSVGFVPILDGSQATRGRGLLAEWATRQRRRCLVALALSFYFYGLIKAYPKIMDIVKTRGLESIKYERMDVVVAQLFMKVTASVSDIS